ncbi:MAG: putative beta-barrel porin 2 [Verrucomicrobiota bacterium]
MILAPRKILLTWLGIATTGAIVALGQELAAVVPDVEPAKPDAPDATPAAAGDTNNASFRYTFPVRDAGSNQVYTEQSPPMPTEIGVSKLADATDQVSPAAPAQVAPSSQADISPAPKGRSHDAPPEDFVGQENLPSQPTADIGEGRFERRPFRYSFAVKEGYNSNVNTTQNDPIESLFTQISGGVAYDFGSSRLKLNTSFDAGLTFYYNNEGLSNDGLFPTLTFVLGAEYAATPRLALSFNTYTALLSQPDYGTSGAPNSQVGNYIISDTTIGAKYLWAPKFATETTYNPRFYYYFEDSQNDIQGRFEQTVGQQFLFLWKPTTALVGEYRFDTRDYFTANDLDSVGNFLLLGFDHTLNPRSTLTVRGGVEQRFNKNPTPGQNGDTDVYFGPFGEVNFNYALGKDTSVGLQARYGTTASGLSYYNQGQQLLLGLTGTRQLTRRISASVFFNYQNNYYTQPGGDNINPNYYDNVFNTGLNVNFLINRVLSLQAGYAYSTLISSQTDQQRDYTQSIVFLGTQLSF